MCECTSPPPSSMVSRSPNGVAVAAVAAVDWLIARDALTSAASNSIPLDK
jgi:hypothetical protein